MQNRMLFGMLFYAYERVWLVDGRFRVEFKKRRVCDANESIL